MSMAVKFIIFAPTMKDLQRKLCIQDHSHVDLFSKTLLARICKKKKKKSQ